MNRQVVLAAFLLLVASVSPARASSWRQISDDGRFVLVMIYPAPLKQDIEYCSPAEAEEVREIRDTYAKSGLYPNDGSTKPLWTVPYHWRGHDIHLSEDGKYLVVFIPYWQERFPEDALYFYTNGKLVRSYDEYSGIPFAKAKETAFMIFENLFFGDPEPLDLSAKFDGAKHTFTITTAQYETITFDTTTGKIIHHWSPWMLYTGFPLVMIPFLTWLYARRPVKRKHDSLSKPWQFSLRQTFFLMALLSVEMWLIRSDFGLHATLCGVGFVGGFLGWWWAKTWNAWILGAVLSLYGFYCGLLLIMLTYDIFPWWFGASIVSTVIVLGIAGGLSAGLIERRRFKREAIS